MKICIYEQIYIYEDLYIYIYILGPGLGTRARRPGTGPGDPGRDPDQLGGTRASGTRASTYGTAYTPSVRYGAD